MPLQDQIILLVIQRNPSDGSSIGQLESACQTVHHDPSAPFQLQTTLECSDANTSRILALSIKNDTDTGSHSHRSNRLLHRRTKISQSKGIMQALPTVAHAKDLCRICHQSLMGSNYASPNLHKTLIICNWYTISGEGFMQNTKEQASCHQFAMTMNLITTFSSNSLQQVSPS